MKADQGFCSRVHAPFTNRTRTRNDAPSTSASSQRPDGPQGGSMTALTLGSRLRDKDRQRFFVTYLAGKMIGIVLAFGLVYSAGSLLIGKVAHADDVQDQITSVVNGTNTAWVIVAAFLVFFMQAGFMM